jgi:peptide/nickel transport system substrate-binding protein
MRLLHLWMGTALAGMVMLAVVACGRNEAHTFGNSSTPQSAPRHGGEGIVLLSADYSGSWPAGLDPATNYTGGANLSLMNAIFGGLFQLTADADGSNARSVPILAAGYDTRNEGRTFIIRLRPGMTFSDGTAFDAAAVKFNIDRALKSPCACSPHNWPWVAEESARVSMPDDHTVELNFSQPYGPLLNSITVSNINWIASPTALKAMGEDEFKIRPVGAGPFRVISNQLSSRLVLERNPNYWQVGRPYLDRLVFQSIGSEQAGLQAVVAGDAQAFVGMASTALIEQAEKSSSVTLTQQLSTSPNVIQLNTAVAPFENPRAREAIYYATDAEAIARGLFKSRYPVNQSFTTRAGLFHHEKIEGYRTYDLEKARAIVRELGGVRLTLATLKSTVPEQIITALQSQWQQAGFEVTLESYDLGTLINSFNSGKWQAMLQTAGSYDPDSATGLRFRFGSTAPFSGVHDEQLDKLIAAASSTMDAAQRDELYLQTARYISEHAYAPFLVANGTAQVTRGLYGPGLTTKIPPVLVNTSVLWQDVWLAAN